MKHSIIAALAAATIGVPAMAQNGADTGPTVFDPAVLTFTGKVQTTIDDTVLLRDPNGRQVAIDGDAFEGRVLKDGRTMSVRYPFNRSDPVFQNSSCGGSFDFATPQTAGPCSIRTRPEIRGGGPVTGTFFSGQFFQEPPFIEGLSLTIDPVSGALTADVPGGSYRLGYVTVPNYQYDSASRAISGPNLPCINAFDCPDDIGTGTLDRLRFPLTVTGDNDLSQVNAERGYDAGSAGWFDLVGGFAFNLSPTPVPVPAPGMLLIFGGGALAVVARRKRKISATR